VESLIVDLVALRMFLTACRLPLPLGLSRRRVSRPRRQPLCCDSDRDGLGGNQNTAEFVLHGV